MCFAKQSSDSCDSLPPDGIVLDSGWRFLAGDIPEYANPDFDEASGNSSIQPWIFHTSIATDS
jgi:hypothetical protein